MPPNNQLHQQDWLDIEDFSPGIFSHDNTNAPTTDRLLPAPPGAADASGTYGCFCLPNGGLAAALGQTASYTWTEPDEPTNYIVGLLVHNELSNGTTEAFIVVEYDDGTNHTFVAYSFIVETSTFTQIILSTIASHTGIFGAPYPAFTRVNLVVVDTVTLSTTNEVTVASGGFPGVLPGDFAYVISGTGTIPEDTTVLSISGNNLFLSNNTTAGTADLGFTSTTTPGNPVIAFPGQQETGGTTIGQVYLYPDPSNPTAYGVFPMLYVPGSGAITGQLIAHQNRILILAGIDYGFPAGGGINVNEQIDYTDPPNSAALGGQETVLAAESPYGYGAFGSISAGELFLVKKRGGGIVVTGDIFSPNVTILPGVQPTGGIVGQASSGKDGFFYCSYENGAWVWNGGNTATKVSSQLDDQFFLPPEFATMLSNNYGFYAQCIGDKVYFSNNYMYDTRSHSWWKYAPDTAQGGVSLFWVQPVTGRYLYMAPLHFGDGGTFLYQFDMETPASTYQWTSLPLKLGNEDRVVDIREVVIRASCSAASVATITVSILDNGSVVWGPQTMTGNVDTGPEMIRFNAAALGVTKPQVRILVETTPGDDNAVVHSISLNYKQRAHQATTN